MAQDGGGLEMAIDMTGEHFRFHGSRRGAAGRFAFTWTLAPGKNGPPEHVHPDETERFTIVSGTLRIFVRDAVHDLGPGSTFAVPPNTPHRFHNPGSVPVVVEVETDGTALEDAMVPTALHFRGLARPGVRDLARMLVTDVARRGSVATSALLRAAFEGLAAMLRAFGVRPFDPVEGWENG